MPNTLWFINFLSKSKEGLSAFPPLSRLKEQRKQNPVVESTTDPNEIAARTERQKRGFEQIESQKRDG